MAGGTTTNPNSAPPGVQSGQQTPGNQFNGIGTSAYNNTLGTNTPSAFGTTTSSTEAPPSAAQSAYEYQQYVAGASLTIGPELATLLGIPAGQTTGDKVMRAFENLSSGDLIQLEQWLWQAGYYQNVEGVTSTTRPDLGARDIPAFAAMSQAILQASDYNVTLSDLITNAVAAGVGKTAEEGQLQPIQQGGNTYQITLPNPDDVYQSAYQVFEQELGRAPTQAELQALTQSLDKQTQLYQQSLNTQQEQMSQQKYQSALASRQAEISPAVTPNVPVQVQVAQQANAAKSQKSGQQAGGQRTVGGGNVNSVNPPQTLAGQAQAQQAQTQAQQAQVAATMAAAAKNPAVAKYLASQAAAADAQRNPQVQAYLQAQNIAGQPATQMTAPGDTYIPANTLTTTQAPTAAGLAFTEATTGANQNEYLANQYLQAYQTVIGMMQKGPTGG